MPRSDRGVRIADAHEARGNPGLRFFDVRCPYFEELAAAALCRNGRTSR